MLIKIQILILISLYNSVYNQNLTEDSTSAISCNCNGYSEDCYFDAYQHNLTGQGQICFDCKENRDGSNCERCKENFYMRDDGNCINCTCDPNGSRSLQCNTEGKCQCKPSVSGLKCDRCEADYFQFSSPGCLPCDCDPRGSFDNTPSCDPESGICYCKENVEGTRCKECKPGFFNLDRRNRFGCTPCFCYGHTSACQSASGYSIVSLLSSFNKHQERWMALDNYDRKIDLIYNQSNQSIGTNISNINEYAYFVASDIFLGDQRASYNRFIKFRLQLVNQNKPRPTSLDVIIEGSGTKISLPIFAQGNGMPNQNMKTFSFRLHEHPDYQWQPIQSAKDFMTVLSNITAIKIRASYSVQGEAILDEFELETAHRGAAGKRATWIEQCNCPEGYLGQFCESCAPGFRHSPAHGGPFKSCLPCDCNKHAEICDPETGKCICQQHTAGDTCDHCARGYYGNASSGTPYDCKQCPCPNDGPCQQLPDNTVICLECPIGYLGARCEQCSDGFYGDPFGLNGEVRPCKPCDCNGNVDPNVFGNCNRITGECLKCIYNTGGRHCHQCLPGYFGDLLSLPREQCEQCNCYGPGTNHESSQCHPITGQCVCKRNVYGRDCNICAPGYYISPQTGCEKCNCNLEGSFNSTCDTLSGQCYCKPAVTGRQCE